MVTEYVVSPGSEIVDAVKKHLKGMQIILDGAKTATGQTPK